MGDQRVLVYLCRNTEGKLDSEGRVWAAPYRWGSMVIAYKKSKFQKHNLAPIEVSCLSSFQVFCSLWLCILNQS
ncbi:unnamed protein product [Ilex paraguariensis]|uniref:Uncharacterized protein n=1 Tax=Ilex paraguariensis TaxID=185542 RepID=A0ABC8UD17_9AQUA